MQIGEHMNNRTTRKEDLLTMVFGTWLMLGLFVDANQHVRNPGLETFLTPWHALFYSGFTATALWITVICFRRRQTSGGIFQWAPTGYKPALYGLAIFSAGGVGDAIWHTVFGIEESIDALLSPTHLVLWIGMILILSAPFRAAWHDHLDVERPTFRSFLPVTLSLTWTTSIIVFFLEYAWLLAWDGPARLAFEPGDDVARASVIIGISGVIVTTVILMGPALLMQRRWHVPFGTFTFAFAVGIVTLVIGFEHDPIGIIPSIAGGLALDAANQVARTRPRIAAIAGPLVMWSAYFYGVSRLPGGLGWPVEIWGGAIMFGIFTALAINQLIESAGELATHSADRPLQPI